ncbi:hypothetical protein BXY58_2548 [Epilithonimonas arachidiradicis]|uniref:Uncharacterized protein n=1 Tax=Epilithonimonas arachidiradicis TaxID=1617282 RepID=A0A420D7Y5_9FLAO|nr:hypothetical protein BXY58_2548 [Epilithonimonas arachidiradicis]
MFTAFFVLAQYQKKSKKAILKVTYSVTYRKNIKNRSLKSSENPTNRQFND